MYLERVYYMICNMVLLNESEWMFKKLDWFHLILNFRLCRSFGFSWQAVWSRMPSMPLIEMSSEEEPLSCRKDQPWWVLSRWSMKTIENPWFWSMVRLREDFVLPIGCIPNWPFHAPLSRWGPMRNFGVGFSFGNVFPSNSSWRGNETHAHSHECWQLPRIRLHRNSWLGCF